MNSTRLSFIVAAALTIGIAMAACPTKAQTVADRPGDITADAAKNERDAVYTEAELALSKRLLDQVIARADSVVKAMTVLTQESDALDQRMAKLAEGDEGKRLASTLDELSARDTAKMLATAVVERERVAANLKQAEALAQQLKTQRENVVAGYVPPEALIGELDNLSAWGRNQRARIKDANEWIDQQLLGVAKDFEVAKAAALSQVLLDFQRREAATRDAARRAGLDKAKAEGQAMITQAAHQAELGRIRQEADARLAESQAEVARQKTELEARLKQQTAEMEARFKQQQDAFDQQMADLNSKLASSRAERAKQEAKAQIVETQGKEDATMLLKRQEAASPAILQQIATFAAPGYYNPDVHHLYGRLTMEPKPMSLSALREYGALERNERGLGFLLTVACTRKDKMRPRWGAFTSVKGLSPQNYAALSSMQQCLIDYGEIFVEMGVLSK